MVLDTNILIDYLKGDEVVIETVRQWFADGIGLFISAVTYAEVLAFKGILPLRKLLSSRHRHVAYGGPSFS